MNHDLQTDTHDGDLVVFLLGMRPRRTWRLGQAAFVGRSLRRMQAEIERDRKRGGALGYLGGKRVNVLDLNVGLAQRAAR